MTARNRNDTGGDLVRALTAVPATALVVGVVVGTGIFLKTAVMTQEVGRPALVLAAWGVAGLLSLAGALTYAELAAMIPEAGGEFVYIRAAYGDFPAFLYGWMRYIVGAGAIAAFGAAFAGFAGAVIPIGPAWAAGTIRLGPVAFHPAIGPRQLIAVSVVLAASAVNLAGVKIGGRLQAWATAAKVAGLAAIVVGVFAFARSGTWAHLSGAAAAVRAPGFSAFGAATMAAFWAYSGWNYVAMAGGEVAQPSRNLPRALVAGTLLVIAAYAAVNLAYFYALAPADVAASSSTLHPEAPPVATRAVGAFLGPRASAATGILFLVSIVAGLNGVVLAVTRLPFAMARAGLFFAAFGRLTRRSRVPALSIIVAAVWASVLACTGSFDELTNMALSGYALFYAIAASALFVLRRRRPDAVRPYRTPGYPAVPALFVVGMLALLGNALRTSPLEAGAAMALIALGIPVYGAFRGGRAAASASRRE